MIKGLFVYFSPDNMGLLDPATSDGRVIFFLPWEKMTIAGTTDTPTNVTAHPIPGEDDINFILNEVRNYLSPDVVGTVTVIMCLTDELDEIIETSVAASLFFVLLLLTTHYFTFMIVI